MKRRAWLRRDARSKVVAAEEADYSSCSCHEVRWRARLMTQLKQLLRRGPRRAQKSFGPTLARLRVAARVQNASHFRVR